MPITTPKTGIYKHYKGDIYKVIGIADNATNVSNNVTEQFVVYAHTVNGRLFIRSKEEFIQDVQGQPRFRLLYETP